MKKLVIAFMIVSAIFVCSLLVFAQAKIGFDDKEIRIAQ
jgi:hypothetical protein